MHRIDLRRFSFKQLMELDACTRCGQCLARCPTFAEAQRDEIAPMDKLTQFRSFVKGDYGGWLARAFGHRPKTEAGLERLARGAYDCTLCGRCHVACPVGIDTRPLWIAMRQELVSQGKYPAPLDVLRERVSGAHNISGEENSRRLSWTENLEHVPQGLDRNVGAGIVYFAGCVAALYPAVFGIPQAFVQTLERAGVAFTTLGVDEWCCGYPLIIAGMGDAARSLVRHNVNAVRAIGARILVTTCPSCYHTWAHDYPRVLEAPLGFRVMHSTELLAELVDSGEIKPGELPLDVTYHDPCDLGRTSGIFELPRNVLRSIPGVNLHEMADNREQALCCGGGGDAEMASPELTAQVAKRRLEQAQATGARTIVSACQQCKRTLAAAARRDKVRIKVMDLTEVVWESIQ